MAELRTLLKTDDKLKLYALSIDSPEINKGLAERVAKDGNGSVGFQILSDPNHKTIDAYGLFDPKYVGEEFEGIPHPTVVVLDGNLKVAWIKVEPDYRKRPTNAEIRMEIDKLSPKK